MKCDKTTLILFIAFNAISYLAKSQQSIICKDVTGIYPPSVSAKLYKLTGSSIKNLSCKEQMDIATKIYKDDSILLAKINSGANEDVINSITMMQDKELEAITPIYNNTLSNKRIEEMQYYTQQLIKINIIKKIDTARGNALQRKGIDLLYKMPNADSKTRFDIAFMQTISDTVYYIKLYPTEVANLYRSLLSTENYKLNKLRLTGDNYTSIENLVREKAKAVALVTLSNNGKGKKGDSTIANTTLYYDSLLDVALIKSGAVISSSLFNAAVRFRNYLGLREAQTDSIIEKGMHINYLKDSAWQKNNLTSLDTKDFENFWLSKILEPDQLLKLLGMKYRDDAQKNAENDWKDLEKRGLAKGMDKSVTLVMIAGYYLKLKAGSTMYAYDLNKQTLYLASIKQDIPEALKKLNYARKNNVSLNTESN